jgi:hypothetical protein
LIVKLIREEWFWIYLGQMIKGKSSFCNNNYKILNWDYL